MAIKAELVEENFKVRRYKVQYPISAYTFPKENLIHQAGFDDEFIHIEFTDGRRLSVPLWWIPTLYNAPAVEREKFQISQDRTALIWDPATTALNDELRPAEYLGTHL